MWVELRICLDLTVLRKMARELHAAYVYTYNTLVYLGGNHVCGVFSSWHVSGAGAPYCPPKFARTISGLPYSHGLPHILSVVA